MFIGHGAPAPDGKGGVLVGYDAQQDAETLYARSLPQSELEDIFASAKAPVVAIVDACFSGRTASGHPLVPGLQPLLAVKQPVEGKNTSLLMAGRSDEFAGPLPGADRPAFSYLVLGALRGWGDGNKDGSVSAAEAIDYSRDVLRTLVTDRNQNPEAAGTALDRPLGRGSERGPDIASLVLTRASPTATTGFALPPGGPDPALPTVTLVPGGKDIATAEAQPLYKRPTPWFIAAGVSTAVSLGTALLGHQRHSAAMSGGCPGSSTRNCESDVSRIKTYNTLSQASLGVAILGAGLGFVFLGGMN